MPFDSARADRAVRFFESLKHTKGRFAGQHFKLLPWQEKIIREVYGTVDENGHRIYQFVYLEVPKKNGKSELAAGAALYHLFADGEQGGEIYGCAADKEQASIVFKVAVDMIKMLPALQKRCKIVESKKEIHTDQCFYKVLSAEAFTKHGLNVSACIFDELHAQPNRSLWDVMTFGAGDAREQPIWWVITTAGDDPDRVSIAWEQHEYAERVLAGDILNPTWHVTIFGYDGDDIWNEANWYAANPSLDHTIKIEAVRKAAEKARENPAEEKLFRWLRLNQWPTTKLSGWLDLDLFDKTKGNWSVADLAGLECYMGMDLSSTTDLTALCLVFPPQGTQFDWRVIWKAYIPEEQMKERIANDKVPYDQWIKAGWVEATPGRVVDYTRVEEQILEWRKTYKVLELDADRAFAAMLIQRLEQAGMTVVDVPQTYMGLNDAMDTIQVKLESGEMTHESNLTARWCFGNTSVAVNGSALKKYVKQTRGKGTIRTKRIDTTAAWVIAMARARFHKPTVDLSAKFKSADYGM